jgi:hypothetical protein
MPDKMDEKAIDSDEEVKKMMPDDQEEVEKILLLRNRQKGGSVGTFW